MSRRDNRKTGGDDSQKLLPLTEAATYARLTNTDLIELVRSGQIQPIRIAGKLHFLFSDLDRLTTGMVTGGKP